MGLLKQRSAGNQFSRRLSTLPHVSSKPESCLPQRVQLRVLNLGGLVQPGEGNEGNQGSGGAGDQHPTAPGWAELGCWAMGRVAGGPQGGSSGTLELISALRALTASTLLTGCESQKNKGIINIIIFIYNKV